MNLKELTEIIQYVRKTTECPNCKRKYNLKDISVLASTKFECLLELKCHYCKKTALTDIVATPKKADNVPLINQVLTEKITDNDVLDAKIFLDNFDGDFKKLFHT